MANRKPYFNNLLEVVSTYDNTWYNYTTSPPYYEDTTRHWGHDSALRRVAINADVLQFTTNAFTAVDLTNATHVIVEYHVNDYPTDTQTATENQKTWNTVRVLLGDNALSDNGEWDFQIPYTDQYVMHGPGAPGYHRYVFPIGNLSDDDNWGTIKSAVVKARVQFNSYDASGDKNGDLDVTLLRVAAATLVDEPRIFITHDDCNDQAPDFSAAAAALGLPVTFYCVPTYIDTEGYCTSAQLAAIKNAGHLIASHTYEHEARYHRDGLPLDASDLQTEGEVKYQGRAARDWLLDNGYVRGARLQATPWTDYDLQTLKWLTEGPDPICYQVRNGYAQFSGYAYVVDYDGTPAGEFLDEKNWPWYTDPVFPSSINYGSIPDGYSMSDVIDLIDSHNCSLVIFLHNYNASIQTDLEAIAVAVNTGRLRAATMDELLGLGHGTLAGGGGGRINTGL